MTKFETENYKQVQGYQAQPTVADEVSSTVVSGAGADTRHDRGHKNIGQKIRKGVELLTRSNTAVYQTSGDIDPARVSAYVLRPESSSFTIELAKPPAVPDDQRTPSGKARHRTWVVELFIYYPRPTTLNWPENVLFETPPSNPRTTGRTDHYRLTYSERSGEWFAECVVLNVLAYDPIIPRDDATQPSKPPDGENGDDDSEHEYIDENGNVILPTRPAGGRGKVVAIQEGAVSVSEDGGSNWRKYPHKITTPELAVYHPKDGIGILSDGIIHMSKDGVKWEEITFKSGSNSEFPIINGDFELGDTTGWDLVSGDHPRVLSSTDPEQLPTSRYYLTRDWRIWNPQDFVVQQIVANTEQQIFTVSADMHAAEHAKAKLKILYDEDNIPRRQLEWNYVQGGQATVSYARYSENRFLKLVIITLGSEVNSVEIGKNTQYGNVIFQNHKQRPSPTNTRYDISIVDEEYRAVDEEFTFSIDYIYEFSRIQLITTTEEKNGRYDFNFSFYDPTTITDVSTGISKLFTGGAMPNPHQYEGSIIRRAKGHCQFIFRPLPTSRLYVEPTAFFALSTVAREGGVEEIVVENSLSNEWESQNIRFVTNRDFTIQLEGSGDPAADVYFDNVFVTTEKKSAVAITGLGTGLRGLLYASESEIYTSSSHYCDCPLAARYIAEIPGLLVASSGNETAYSYDKGKSWRTIQNPASALYVCVGAIVGYSEHTGDVYEYTASGVYHRENIGSGSALAQNKKTELWTYVSKTFEVFTSNDLMTWVSQGHAPKNEELNQPLLLALQSGRLIVGNYQVLDLLYRDPPAPWIQGISRDAPIYQLIEM